MLYTIIQLLHCNFVEFLLQFLVLLLTYNSAAHTSSIMATKLPREENIGSKRFADFDLAGKVFIVTGGARGLGLAIAEALVEAGGKGR